MTTAGFRRRFAPAAGWTVLAAAGVALFVGLGYWQLGRAEEKRARLEGFATGAAEVVPLPEGSRTLPRYQAVKFAGRYLGERQFLLDNMTHGGVAGYRVLTPMQGEDGRIVLVDRGFVAGSGDRAQLPDISVGAGLREVHGRADFLPRPGIELGGAAASGWPRVVSFPHIEDVAAALERDVYGQLILLDPGEPDGYLRDWQPPGFGPERHVGYAVQWFAFAVTAVVIWVLLSFRKEKIE